MFRRRRKATQHDMETPRQLAARYWSELLDLVEEGEISPAFARRVRDDLFVSAEPDQEPVLRPHVWRAYVTGFTGGGAEIIPFRLLTNEKPDAKS